ncbi:reverse transcriptase [Gossypium australe]|uniref:Reverse transcriptase n=1 Tax=Gossypium australe TaxID=47621 RepID=A0A5B6W060_9ROSI|nr:reverse transcriptase [Gossypium australe]
MSPLKALGIDGFPALFFQKYWDIVGSDISRYCLAILKGEINMDEINKTHIVLIPKIDKPKNLSQFRPISLCNVIYKIIAKVVVNRMSLALGHCIDEAQGAFIAGRQISDNTLIAYEILHSLKTRKYCKQENFALKLDMSKAYDRVEWDFLAGMMASLGFCQEWIILIMRCVCSVSYTMGINEGISDIFTPLRGLRQGDPFSPYLFLICAEGLLTLLNEAKQKRLMIGAPLGRERFSINHFIFADDCFLFGDASEDGAYTVCSMLEEYGMASGQQVNFEKSLFYFGASVDQQVRDQITNILRVRVAVNPEKYLGLPMMVGRRKRWVFANFVDRFRKRIESWNLRFLSMGVGSYPSFTWRSICGARELIADGLLWRIGNGRMVNIWNDLGCLNRCTQWSTVNQLIDEHSFTWKDDIIYKLADHDQARRILSIPLARSDEEDVLVWRHDNTGVYTVKSGYRELQLPSKIKIHLWRLTRNYVPHRCNLNKRKLTLEVACPLCKSAPEDSEHLLWSCEVLRRIWNLLDLHVDLDSDTSDGKN